MNNNYKMNFDNINKLAKYGYIISFIFQWSIISMIINIVTLGIFRLPLFMIFIIDALTMINRQNKTIKRPSLIVSKIWDLLESIKNPNSNLNKVILTISNYYRRIKYYLSDLSVNIYQFIENLKFRWNQRKIYNQQREQNKLTKILGSKVYVESIEPQGKIKHKAFKYKDRVQSYVNMLNNMGYKDYSTFSVDVNLAPSYLVINNKRDLIDLNNNKIKIKTENKDYKFVTEGWPSTKKYRS